MTGFLIALISGTLMSVQGVFNTQVTKTTGMWVSNAWVQFSAFVLCFLVWLITGRDSIALCEQITSVAVERLGEYCGVCNNQELAAIDTALMISLDLSTGNVQEKEVFVEVVKEVPVEVIKEVPAVVGVGNAEEVTDLRCKLATANAQLDMMQKMYNDLLVKAMK